MRRTRTALIRSLSALILVGACIPALAAPYRDRSTTDGSKVWNLCIQERETAATDYTKVSLTPGEKETKLNFAWYNQDNGSAATPVARFGTNPSSLTAFTGTTGAAVVNPQSILYMAANSASSSKFYEPLTTRQNYIAARSQNWPLRYFVIEIDENSFTIDVYPHPSDGPIEAMDQIFTMEKRENILETSVQSLPMTRADAVQTLYEAAGSPAASGTVFSDVTADASYAQAIVWAARNGIAVGCGNRSFAPNAPVTREQLAVMVIRYAALQGRTLSDHRAAFNACLDAVSVSAWARSSVAQVLNGGLLMAENGTFRPAAPATTDELAAALAQLPVISS